MLTGRQIREGREMLGWSRADLSFRAHLPLSIVEVVEDHGSTFMLLPGQLLGLRSVLEAAGVEFIPENSGGAGVRLRGDRT